MGEIVLSPGTTANEVVLIAQRVLFGLGITLADLSDSGDSVWGTGRLNPMRGTET
ncbi:hypothetical protein GCM10027271_44930 [Saccharopolyspora gloriosae]|uniref:Uncharacterized protein n=1 Tax=Saccharopolyspora gloriosae TaxID=455344 RepID=A0A840NPN1_9PSEU|nr:hypothetical protein [Saccharopolyspora gloriosae]